MALALLHFLGLALIVVAAGILLAYCADAIAEATGLGRVLIGSILLAGATSLPELSVDVAAVRQGMPALAIGDLLGSSLMNLLILAVLDLSWYSRGKMLSRTAAGHALGGLFSIALTGLVALGLLTAKWNEQLGLLRLHLGTWVVAAAYLLGVRMVFLDQRISARSLESEKPAEHAKVVKKLWRPAAGFAIATAMILLVGPALAESAGVIADLTGLGKTFVGTTLVALSTSLPELAASVAALRMGAFDLVVGNVLGSNAFNMMLFVPLDLVQPGALFAHATEGHLVTALGAIVATSVVVIGQLYHVERRIRFCEPDAWLVILVVVASLGLVYLAA